MIVERVVAQHRTRDQRERQVAAIDGDALPLRDVHARLAAAQLAVIGDIVVDQRGRLEVLDRRRRATGRKEIAAHGLACQHADEGAVTLAGVVREAPQGGVQVRVDIGALRLVAEERGQVIVDLIEVAVEKAGERGLHGESSILYTGVCNEPRAAPAPWRERTRGITFLRAGQAIPRRTRWGCATASSTNRGTCRRCRSAPSTPSRAPPWRHRRTRRPRRPRGAGRSYTAGRGRTRH